MKRLLSAIFVGSLITLGPQVSTAQAVPALHTQQGLVSSTGGQATPDGWYCQVDIAGHHMPGCHR